MGLEATCKISWQSTARRARVHLDSNKLDVYVKPTLHVAFSDMRNVRVLDGELQIVCSGGTLVLQLGAAAQRWADKIKQPKSRLDKLGIKPGSLVCLRGAGDPEFDAELAERTDRIHRRPVKGAELVFLYASAVEDLAELGKLRTLLAPHGAVWVVRQKGKAASVREAEVRAAAQSAGLVAVKVVAFSQRLTADKFVIPVAER